MNIKEYPKVDAVTAGEVFLLDGPRGTKTIPADKFEIVGSGASYANSLVKEYSLGDRLTSEQSEDIRSGRFELVRVGGYWVINGRKYWAADADYRFNTGNEALITHHMLVIPDVPLYSASMNTYNVTEGGYVGSKMYKSNLAQALKTVESDFGIDHILPYEALLTNAVSGGVSSGWIWQSNRKIDLMSEKMVYGSFAWGGGSQKGFDTGIDKSQISLFRARHDLITCRYSYWLRDVSSSSEFCYVDWNGRSSSHSAGTDTGIRPSFLVY